MRQNFRLTSLVIATILIAVLSAWNSRTPTSSGDAPVVAGNIPASAPKVVDEVQSKPVEFTGTIQTLNGNQWRVNGMNVIVDAQALGGMPVGVGDTFHFRGSMAADGTITAVNVGAFIIGISSKGPAPVTRIGNTIYFSGSNANGSQNSSGLEITGVVGTINGDQITIDGVTYTLAPGVDSSSILVGDTVEIEFITNTDGSLTITEIHSSTSMNENSNGDDDEEFSNGNSNNSNDDENEDDDNDEGNNNGTGDDD